MGNLQTSGHSVERASCPERGAQFSGRSGNLNKIKTIKAQAAPIRNGEIGHFRLGKAERIDREMAYIAQVRKLQQPGNSNLCGDCVRERAIKKLVARIFDKNSFGQIFSSYVAQDKLPLDFLAVFAARKL